MSRKVVCRTERARGFTDEAPYFSAPQCPQLMAEPPFPKQLWHQYAQLAQQNFRHGTFTRKIIEPRGRRKGRQLDKLAAKNPRKNLP